MKKFLEECINLLINHKFKVKRRKALKTQEYGIDSQVLSSPELSILYDLNMNSGTRY